MDSNLKKRTGMPLALSLMYEYCVLKWPVGSALSVCQVCMERNAHASKSSAFPGCSRFLQNWVRSLLQKWAWLYRLKSLVRGFRTIAKTVLWVLFLQHRTTEPVWPFHAIPSILESHRFIVVQPDRGISMYEMLIFWGQISPGLP